MTYALVRLFVRIISGSVEKLRQVTELEIGNKQNYLFLKAFIINNLPVCDELYRNTPAQVERVGFRVKIV